MSEGSSNAFPIHKSQIIMIHHKPSHIECVGASFLLLPPHFMKLAQACFPQQ